MKSTYFGILGYILDKFSPMNMRYAQVKPGEREREREIISLNRDVYMEQIMYVQNVQSSNIAYRFARQSQIRLLETCPTTPELYNLE